jgi:hypothetical protein
MSNREGQNWVVVVSVALLIASIVYCPQHIKFSTGGGSSSFSNSAGMTSSTTPATETDHIQYGWIWEAPEHSSLEFGRLVATWLAIGAVAAGGLFLNRTPREQRG